MTVLIMPGLPLNPTIDPMVGSRASLIRYIRDPLSCLQSIYKMCGLLGTVNMGDPSIVCAFGPDYNRQVLTNTQTYYHLDMLPMPVTPDPSWMMVLGGVIRNDDDQVRQQRRLIASYFHRKGLEAVRETITQITETFLATWTHKNAININKEIREITRAIMSRCVLGLGSETRHVLLDNLIFDFLEQILSVRVILLPSDTTFTSFQQLRYTVDILNIELSALIEEKKRSREPGNDILSLFLMNADEQGYVLGDAELVTQIILFFIAGYKMTCSLVWILFLLTQHPLRVADLVDELTSKLNGEAPSSDQGLQLPLLDRIIKESMRLLPVTPALYFRQTQPESSLGNYEIPKGSYVVLSPLITHRLGELYSEPLHFNPNRWENIPPGPFDYLPFGAGIYKCLGAGFAEFCIRLVLAMILQRYRLSIPPNTTVNPKMRGIIMDTQHALIMHIYPQDRCFKASPEVRGRIHELVTLPTSHTARIQFFTKAYT